MSLGEDSTCCFVCCFWLLAGAQMPHCPLLLPQILPARHHFTERGGGLTSWEELLIAAERL
jgi:hypothetical protein